MTFPAGLRRERILEWLTETHILTIEDLSERLGVSTMTVHRDLNWLADTRRVVKVHGGAMLAEKTLPDATTRPRCTLCGMPVPHRTAFKIRTQEGRTLHACCPHCGLLALKEHDPATSALTREFLYGRMVNARQAAYLVESAVSACCLPSVLSFATDEDAQRFQVGFGGERYSFEQALAYLVEHHAGHHSAGDHCG